MKAGVLGHVAAEQMKAIEELDGEGAVQAVCSIVGIQAPDGNQMVRMRANCPLDVQLALVEQARHIVVAQIRGLGGQG